MNSEQIRKFFADYQVVLKRVEQLEAAMAHQVRLGYMVRRPSGAR